MIGKWVTYEHMKLTQDKTFDNYTNKREKERLEFGFIYMWLKGNQSKES